MKTIVLLEFYPLTLSKKHAEAEKGDRAYIPQLSGGAGVS